MFEQKPGKFYLWCAFACVVVALYIYNYYYAARDWSVHVFVTVFGWSASMFVTRWAFQDFHYSEYLKALDDTKPAIHPQPEPRHILNLSEQAYQQTTDGVKIDKKLEQRFAQVLIAMRGLAPDDKGVDLREGFWIEAGKRDKFQSRQEFLAVRDKWADYSILLRLDPNLKRSSFYVADWRKVELIAKGERLQ